MNRAWAQVEYLRTKNARQRRRGWRLQDGTVSQNDRLDAAVQEIWELKDSSKDGVKPDIKELADIMIVLMDFAQREGWTQDDIDDAMLLKMDERFEVDA